MQNNLSKSSYWHVLLSIATGWFRYALVKLYIIFHQPRFPEIRKIPFQTATFWGPKWCEVAIIWPDIIQWLTSPPNFQPSKKTLKKPSCLGAWQRIFPTSLNWKTCHYRHYCLVDTTEKIFKNSGLPSTLWVGIWTPKTYHLNTDHLGRYDWKPRERSCFLKWSQILNYPRFFWAKKMLDTLGVHSKKCHPSSLQANNSCNGGSGLDNMENGVLITWKIEIGRASKGGNS